MGRAILEANPREPVTARPPGAGAVISRLAAGGLAGLALCAASAVAGPAEVPRVVASVKPIHALVAGVMAGIGEPTLLVKGAGSPHAYALRPSDARALQDADVVFWVGPGLESFLARPLAALPRAARVVALAQVPGVVRRDAAGAPDPHIWLDPVNALALVDRMVATLAAADPTHGARYRANGAALKDRIADLDADLARDLAPLRGRRYVVFHDAYGYFEARYGLADVGAIVANPERKPSARKLRRIRDRIRATGAGCVFAEPQFEPTLVQTVIAGTGARAAVLDPLGADLAPGEDAYFTLLRRLAAALKNCLAPSG